MQGGCNLYFRPRLIPCLSITNRELVKTTKFKTPKYIGDPINAVRIFNEKGVDELCILDIRATIENREPDFDYLSDIASEAFVPLSYGGGIKTIEQIKKLFYIGYEKIIINSSFVNNPTLIKEAVDFAGAQSIVVSIDVKLDFFKNRVSYIKSGTIRVDEGPIELAKNAEKMGVGEILLNSINNDGLMQGYDLDLVKQVSESINIPVIACGGAKDIIDAKKVIEEGKAHAAAASSMYIYYGRQKAVLITAPTEQELIDIGLYKF